MRTDPALIARLAGEIDARLRGAKVRDFGLLPDGRTAIVLWSRGHESALCLDVFAPTPLVTLETQELPISAEPGFIRAAGAALRGTVLLSAKARKGDRLLRLTFGARSRFGVGDESDLYVELVPRFGNIVLVRGDRVVAAAKEFSLADNGTRAVEAGAVYHLPPLVARERPPLHELAEDASVLDAMTVARTQDRDAGRTRDGDERRRTLLRRLEERERKMRSELAMVDGKRTEALARDALRERAEAIYATLYELADEAREERKDEAAALFARYKKLGASLVHLDERERVLRAALEAIEALRWEAERAGEAELADVEQAVQSLDQRNPRRAAAPARRRRAPLEVRTAAGSRILIGRSPVENADLTFRVARPDDLWFHAQNIPGAHVILQRDDRVTPPPEDLDRAASLAAFYSKARSSAKVPIDYTLRKHVRAQRNAPPGLVWYTQPRTILAQPKDVDAQADSASGRPSR
jgi:predicted ribosome quality control (RQC) complex YloA/Tae2 family protein